MPTIHEILSGKVDSRQFWVVLGTENTISCFAMFNPRDSPLVSHKNRTQQSISFCGKSSLNGRIWCHLNWRKIRQMRYDHRQDKTYAVPLWCELPSSYQTYHCKKECLECSETKEYAKIFLQGNPLKTFFLQNQFFFFKIIHFWLFLFQKHIYLYM